MTSKLIFLLVWLSRTQIWRISPLFFYEKTSKQKKYKQERAIKKKGTMNKEDNSDNSFSYKSDLEGKAKQTECEKKSSSDVSPNRNSSPNKEVETNPYLLARAKRISEIRKKLVELGLAQPLVASIVLNELSEDESDEEVLSIDVSTNCPTWKSPRIASQVVDLSGNGEYDGNVRRGVEVVTTRRSPRLANLSIRSPGNDTLTSATSSAGGSTERRSAKKRLWNSELAKSNHVKFKEQINAEIERFGEQKVRHPFKLETIEVKEGRVLEGSKETFMVAIDAFLSHHANYNCRSLNTKSYKTSCNCLGKLDNENNSILIS